LVWVVFFSLASFFFFFFFFFLFSPRSVVLMLYLCHYPSSISPGFILPQFSYLFFLLTSCSGHFSVTQGIWLSLILGLSHLSITPAHFNFWGYNTILIREHFHIFIDSPSLSSSKFIATCINILSFLSVIGSYKKVAPLPSFSWLFFS
jgi:hypothetical protein